LRCDGQIPRPFRDDQRILTTAQVVHLIAEVGIVTRAVGSPASKHGAAELRPAAEQSVITEGVVRFIHAAAVDALIDGAIDLVVGAVRDRKTLDAPVAGLITQLVRNRTRNSRSDTHTTGTGVSGRAEQSVITGNRVGNIVARSEHAAIRGAHVAVVAVGITQALRAHTEILVT
jgi:hypothetical protein